MTKSVRLRCRVCKTRFTVSASAKTKKLFCSRECRGKALVQKAEVVKKPGRRIEVKCATCGVPVFRTAFQVETNERFFCGRRCKHKAQTKELGISGWARRSKSRVESGGVDVKPRPCLGWCGQTILTNRNVRFCESCAARKEFASTGVDEFEYSVNRSTN